MMVAPGRSAQPLASIGRRPSWNHARSGSPDGLASHAILVGSFGAGLAWGWAAGGACFGAGAGGGGGGGPTRAGVHTAGPACAGVPSGPGPAGFPRDNQGPPPRGAAPPAGSAPGPP